jgi:hypothetical protein
MGTYKKGVLGPFSGKVGTVIGSTWNGIEYMRSLPKASTKAATDLQLTQRTKFGFANGFLGPISSLLNQGFKSQAVGKTGFNMASSHLISECITGVYPDFDIDYAKVLFSKGALEGAWSAGVTSSLVGQIELNWDDNSGFGTAKPTDKMVALIYNPAKSKFVYTLENGAVRSAGSDIISMPAQFAGDTVHVWIAFMKSDKTSFSTSIYVGEIELV